MLARQGGRSVRHYAYNFLGTRDGLAARYAGQSRGCAGLTPCLAGGRRTSSANANVQEQVIAQRISGQFLERCRATTALVVEFGGILLPARRSGLFPPYLRDFLSVCQTFRHESDGSERRSARARPRATCESAAPGSITGGSLAQGKGRIQGT